MARQVIGDSLEIHLPTYEQVTSLYVEEIGECLTEKFVVTKKKRVQIENIKIEREFCGVVVDIYGEVGGYPFVVYFTHPGRVIPIELESLEDEKCGIVEVSLSDTYSLFIGDGTTKQSYLEKLRSFLTEDVASKRWVFHPRFEHIQELAKQSLEARREKLLRYSNEELNPNANIELVVDTGSGEKAMYEVDRHEVKYQCLMCGTTWIGIEPGYSPCPMCKTHLYGKRVGYLDNET